MITEPFTLEKQHYTPREVARIYSHHIRPISYPTVLAWIAVNRSSNGKEGIHANQSPRSNRYLIPAEEVSRILIQAGAVAKEN